MKKIELFIIMIFSTLLLKAQSYELVMRSVEQNNTSLKTLRAQIDASKLECHRDIHLDNPEVELGYLWGNPTDMGNRFDFNVSQRFDFPSSYYFKRKIASGKEMQAELLFEEQRREVLLETARIWTELVYFNKLNQEYDLLLENAEHLFHAYQQMYDSGETGVLEFNKAKLNLLAVRKAYKANRIEHDLVIAELERLNGGQTINVSDTLYPAFSLSADFNQWYAMVKGNNPSLKSIYLQQEINRREVQLSKTYWAPQFIVGYNSERILGTTMQGVGVGISLPLWQNRYAVKSVQAQSIALKSAAIDVENQYYLMLKGRYEHAFKLQNLYDEYIEMLSTVNTENLLWKALEKGEISLIDYLLECAIYREALIEAYAAERDFQSAVNELRVYEMF